jgi:hypothetical protein
MCIFSMTNVVPDARASHVRLIKLEELFDLVMLMSSMTSVFFFLSAFPIQPLAYPIRPLAYPIRPLAYPIRPLAYPIQPGREAFVLKNRLAQAHRLRRRTRLRGPLVRICVAKTVTTAVDVKTGQGKLPIWCWYK